MTGNLTLSYIVDKFSLNVSEKGGTEIGGVNRTIIAQTLGELGFKEGAEVGVAEGYHAKVLCENNPGVKLYCIDPWRNYPGYTYRKDMRKVYREARKNLSPYRAVFRRNFSMRAVGRFKDESLDFVYIDGAHDFKNVAMDVCEWARKVRVGGVLFGHDYKRSKTYGMHVKEVVASYMYAHGIKSWFVLKNDVRDPTFGKDKPGWLYVRTGGDKI